MSEMESGYLGVTPTDPEGYPLLLLIELVVDGSQGLKPEQVGRGLCKVHLEPRCI